jgi:methionyl aminopeptidase
MLNIPIIKSKEEIEFYLKFGIKFGSILKHCKSYIEDEVSFKVENILDLLSYYTYREFETLDYSYPFEDQANQYGEKFNTIACISINDTIGHGRPDLKYRLKEGDIISIDFGLKINELYFDGAFTLYFGNQDNKPEWIDRPLRTIKTIKNSGRFYKKTSDISKQIELEANICKPLDIVTGITGHGIGRSLHEAPQIHNANGLYQPTDLIDGLVFCVEPLYIYKDSNNKPKTAQIYMDSDGWSIKTINKQPGTHFETMFLYKDNKLIDLLNL